MNVSCFPRFFAVLPAVVAGVSLGLAPRMASAQTVQTITDLFNTGVNNSGAVLAGGATDPHYFMIANNFGSSSQNTLVNANQLVGTYAQNPTSAYISPDGTDGSAVNGGNYTVTYRTTFTLASNVNLSTVNIVGNWSTDNAGTNIFINGNATGFTSNGFSSFTAFTLPTTFFRAGANTLDFAWRNDGGPGGINVFYTTKTFSAQATGAPEPGSLALLGTAVVPLAGLVVRRRKVCRLVA